MKKEFLYNAKWGGGLKGVLQGTGICDMRMIWDGFRWNFMWSTSNWPVPSEPSGTRCTVVNKYGLLQARISKTSAPKGVPGNCLFPRYHSLSHFEEDDTVQAFEGVLAVFSTQRASPGVDQSTRLVMSRAQPPWLCHVQWT
jgi:hypothetical protein